MYDAGLILEGGGLRGVYTTGVLDFFLDKKMDFRRCYGVSAGACEATSFFTRQRGRGFAVSADYLDDRNYLSLHSLMTTGDLFGVDMVYDRIPNELYPYDYEAFLDNPCEFYAVVTNSITGKAEYLRVDDLQEQIDYVRASSSLPLFAEGVVIDGIRYFDGGIADSIPIQRSIADGNAAHVVVLTRDAAYHKSQNKMLPAIRKKYAHFPAFVRAAETRYLRYNRTLALIRRLEAEGKIFVIRPQKQVTVKIAERNRKKLYPLYCDGYADAERCFDDMMRYLHQYYIKPEDSYAV